MTFFRRVLAIAVVGYIAICAYMFFTQRSMQYRPNPAPMSPANTALSNAQQETLATSDGEKIVTWWVAPKDASQPVFLYLHGNGGNLTGRDIRFQALTKDGAGLLALSYRGYGGSSGSPTEAGFRIDARRAYDELVNKKGIAAKRVVLFGESLGTTVAVLLAAEVPVAGLLLDSSFDSAVDVAARAYPWLPVRWLLLDQFRASDVAAKVQAPVQQVHCRDDPVTPLSSATQLNARFTNARPMQIVETRCHVVSFLQFDRTTSSFASSVIGR